MTGFSKVAIVNLVDDYNKKDYGFALYDEDMNEIGLNRMVKIVWQ